MYNNNPNPGGNITNIFSGVTNRLIAGFMGGNIYRYDISKGGYLKIGHVEQINELSTIWYDIGPYSRCCGCIKREEDNSVLCLFDREADSDGYMVAAKSHLRKGEKIDTYKFILFSECFIRSFQYGNMLTLTSAVNSYNGYSSVLLNDDYRRWISDMNAHGAEGFLDVNTRLPYTNSNNAFGLAAAFVCLQRSEFTEQIDAPFRYFYG